MTSKNNSILVNKQVSSLLKKIPKRDRLTFSYHNVIDVMYLRLRYYARFTFGLCLYYHGTPRIVWPFVKQPYFEGILYKCEVTLHDD